MRKSILRSLAVLTAGILFCSATALAQGAGQVAVASNKFAFELYDRYKTDEGNIFFSPYSISSAMAMAYEGARGKTAEEIREAFHFSQDASLDREAFSNVYKEINSGSKSYTLATANALWAQKDFKFLESYFSLIEQYYGGKATNLDFINETEQSRLTINNWVEEHTNNKIKNLIPAGTLDKFTRLVITNAVYFKGEWLTPFNDKITREEDFRLSNGGTVKVAMMHLTHRFSYAETDKLQVMELPYEGNELSMIILLPKADDLQSLEESLSPDKLSGWENLTGYDEVILSLPKFKFDTSYLLAGDLKQMGMPAAFTKGVVFGGEADFSGMTGNKDLNIDTIIHKAFVEVNEEGTEAAAATSMMTATGKAFGELKPPKVFKADHSFIFLIKHKKTGVILFVGRVSNPAAK
jgi:serpin B